MSITSPYNKWQSWWLSTGQDLAYNCPSSKWQNQDVDLDRGATELPSLLWTSAPSSSSNLCCAPGPPLGLGVGPCFPFLFHIAGVHRQQPDVVSEQRTLCLQAPLGKRFLSFYIIPRFCWPGFSLLTQNLLGARKLPRKPLGGKLLVFFPL